MVEYFGENPKTTSPSMFFSLFSRFTKAYKVCMGGPESGWGTAAIPGAWGGGRGAALTQVALSLESRAGGGAVEERSSWPGGGCGHPRPGRAPCTQGR